MPISAEKKKLYPKNWKEISQWTVINAGNKCEVFDAENHKPHPITKSRVILTVHHCDFNPRNNESYNLYALCQRCHIRLDKKFKAYNRRKKSENENSHSL